MAITIPTNGNPTPGNHKAWSYAVIGLIVTMFVGGVIGAFVGGIIGHRADKARQNKELSTGRKTVDKPAWFNSGLAKGVFFLYFTAFMVGIASNFFALPLEIFAGVVGNFVAGAAWIAVLGCAYYRRSEMVAEYAEAEQINARHPL